MRSVIEQFVKLGAGILIALFHQRLADFILEQDYAVAALLHTRGLRVPAPPRRSFVCNLYFFLGISIALFQLYRIWLMAGPAAK